MRTPRTPPSTSARKEPGESAIDQGSSRPRAGGKGGGGGEGGGGASARAAGGAGDVPRVVGGAEEGVLGRGKEAELGRVGLSEMDAAGVDEPLGRVLPAGGD